MVGQLRLRAKFPVAYPQGRDLNLAGGSSKMFTPTTASVPLLVGPFVVPEPAQPEPAVTLDGALTACVLIYAPPFRR